MGGGVVKRAEGWPDRRPRLPIHSSFLVEALLNLKSGHNPRPVLQRRCAQFWEGDLAMYDGANVTYSTREDRRLWWIAVDDLAWKITITPDGEYSVDCGQEGCAPHNLDIEVWAKDGTTPQEREATSAELEFLFSFLFAFGELPSTSDLALRQEMAKLDS